MTAPPQVGTEAELSLGAMDLRELNRQLRQLVAAGTDVVVRDPRSAHNLGVALPKGGRVRFDGSVGYYCGGLNDGADVVVERNAGWAVGEAMASGSVTVRGDASMSVGASLMGGLIHVQGNAGPRCGVAMKGGDIVVEGSIGYLSAFMAHAGRVVCLGDAGDAAGDSLWGGTLWVGGMIKNLGVDAKIVDPSSEAVAEVEELLSPLGLADGARNWKLIVSAQKLWHFESRDAKQWLMI